MLKEFYKTASEDEGSEKKPKISDGRMQSVFSPEQIEGLAKKVGVDKSLLAEFTKGLKVEREHADVLEGDEIKLAKTVKAHLDEMKNYYTELSKMESKAASLATQASQQENHLTESIMSLEKEADCLKKLPHTKSLAAGLKKKGVGKNLGAIRKSLDDKLKNPQDKVYLASRGLS